MKAGCVLLGLLLIAGMACLAFAATLLLAQLAQRL